MESKRQKQVGKLIQVSLSDLFFREASIFTEGAMVSIANVTLTPDLLIARVYISIFNHPHPNTILEAIELHKKTIRGLLGNKIKSRVRRIPELEFYKDDTLDEVFKLEVLFKEVKEKDDAIAKNRASEES